MGKLIIIAVAALLAGCDLCREGEMRCDGLNMQRCSDSEWEGAGNCSAWNNETCSTSEAACGGYDICCVPAAHN